MKNEYPLERKLERVVDNIWRFLRYLSSKPKNKMQLYDKHTLMIELLSFVFLAWSIIRNIFR